MESEDEITRENKRERTPGGKGIGIKGEKHSKNKN